MLKVTGIAFTIFNFKDVARTRAFYGQTLGLAQCAEMEFAPGKWWIEYDTGEGALALTNFEMPGLSAGASPGVALEIANFDEALAGLRAAGVALVWGPNEFPVCRSAAVVDPDGNAIYLHQRKAAAS
ncbi:MAG: VOC family protein [Opitutae bacterium]|nr:VOC family protein [Opitutae bacterium]